MSAPSPRDPWHDVRVHWPDGRTHLDGIRGADRDHAIARAEWNWGPGSRFGRCARVEYIGLSDDQSDPAEAYEPPDWWGADHPDTHGADA